MARLLFILTLSFGSLAAGYFLQRVLQIRGLLNFSNILKVSTRLKLFAILVLQPLAIIYSFWTLSIGNSQLLTLPILGLFAICVGGISSLILIRLFEVPPLRAASVFVSSMFCNFGIFGGFIAHVMFGTLGYGIVQLFRMFEEVIYYAIGFPMSYQVSKGSLRAFRIRLSLLTDKPIIFVPLSAIVVGFALNMLPVDPIPAFGKIVNIIVPAMTGFLGLGIGLSMKISKVQDFKKEIILVLLTKYLIIPAVIIPVAMILGYGELLEGIVLKVVIIVSFMPTAFMALVPPIIYGFDLDMANSAWLVTTLFLILVFPVVYFAIT